MQRVGLLILLLLLPCAPAAANPPIDPALDDSVTHLAALLSDGIATLDRGRLTPARSGHLVAVVFNLQGPGGGDGSWQFLAFFDTNADLPATPASSRYRLLGFARIGSLVERLFDASTAVLQGRRLRIDGAAFARGDASCCPSHPIRSVFVLADAKVVERRLTR